jgi:hypothetical protein
VTPELQVKSSDGLRLSFGAQIAKIRLYLHSTAVLRYDSNRTAQKIKEIPRGKYTSKNTRCKIHRKYTQPGNTPENTPPGLGNTRGLLFFELQRTCIMHTAGSAKSVERDAVVVV